MSLNPSLITDCLGFDGLHVKAKNFSQRNMGETANIRWFKSPIGGLGLFLYLVDFNTIVSSQMNEISFLCYYTVQRMMECGC